MSRRPAKVPARAGRPVVVLLNRGGGTIAADPKIRGKVRTALSNAGLAPQIEWIEGDECAKRCAALASRGDDWVIVGGGDGTINAAASSLAGSKTALGVLPLGTLNHFARDLGFPVDLGEAAKCLAEGAKRKVDIAELNGRVFINNSSIGLYPLMVFDREQQQKRLGRSKRLALLVASARTLARFKHQRLTLSVGGKKANVRTPLLFVGNNDYRTDIGAAGSRDSIEEGELSVFVMRSTSRLGFLTASLRALINRERPQDLRKIEGVKQLKVDSERAHLRVALDGEVARVETPLTYTIRPKALLVIAPAER